ncbi:MAG TPA: GWxTD domain-containing protein [Bacteroidia bacterium]|nr:GWxTD domain-containing protein [Bacteroidia bacterium]
MKGYKFLILLLFSSLFIVLPGCYSTNKISVQNLSSQYRSDEHYLRPQFTVYHVNDSLSLVYFKIDESNLLYVRRNQADSFNAAVKINCRVTASYDASNIEDTNTAILRFASITNVKREETVGSIALKIKSGSDHLITVTTMDLMSRRTEISYIDVNKAQPGSDQNFMIRDPSTGYIVFSPYIDSAATYAIMYNHKVDKLYVNYYKRSFPTAAPPFSVVEDKQFLYKPDSTFTLKSGTSGVALINLQGEGFYHIMADSNSRSGLTIYRFQKHYPTVSEVYQMAGPLRYITTNDEYDRIMKAQNMKQAIDQFWIGTAGNTKDRARVLIRNYYNRVQDANNYFTSYEEGWKTDRGMVYIVYGAPNIIFRNGNSETWTYGEDKNYMTLSFTFVKTNNPFSDNDYTLQRMPQFRNLWYNAVDIWREGRIY